ncbi:hypothetical protein GH714_004276 [Hevea brasiliensis]|uniref:VOC domain-containing protein n=1 Tax=Hevea brasiliensis TaxID=3981 RepID=A0A6A6N925_HEVBR|nr:hypothetical protein GH714_004131 [Hevea brasiliensis]KAF2321897.1 hypothetical protein GH714_004276 [Hevea brasiliensis]
MATTNLCPAFAYTVVYVKDVAKSLDFYEKAFGYHMGKLDSGQTTIAFTPIHQRETDKRSGAVQTPQTDGERPPLEVCFAYADVDAAYKRAVENGAVALSQPEDKEWGQRVGYVRDIDGIVVRMGSYVTKPAKQD